MRWLIEYTNVEETLRDLLVILYSKGNDLFSQTALEAGGRYQNAKTKFVFDADKGMISLEQKLPMPWAAFNETPDFQVGQEECSLIRFIIKSIIKQFEHIRTHSL
jgi:hypothetical protein